MYLICAYNIKLEKKKKKKIGGKEEKKKERKKGISLQSKYLAL